MIWEAIRDFFSDGPEQEGIFQEEWKGMLRKNLPIYAKLPDEVPRKLHRMIGLFVANTRFEGCNGLDLTDEMIITVAGQACLLVLGRDGDPYPELKVVYLYPSTFSSVQIRQDRYGIVTEGEVKRLGESWEMGTVVLAWDSVESGARNVEDGHNVVLHEFAHQLDHEDGATDGAPEMPSREAYRSWARVFQANYVDFLKKVEKGKKTVLDDYGATNPAEFFAVATETFFEKGKQLQKKRPDLYAKLKEYYSVDPATWG